MLKSDRQNLIRKIVNNQHIHTQEELADALSSQGMNVTQATVSRDIKEMHIVKVLSDDGYYRYAITDKEDRGKNDRLIRILSDSVINMDSAGNLIVIHTLSGSAHVAGEAIDSLNWPEVVGTIAGDNTILVIVRTPEDVNKVLRDFGEIIS